ncbi:MAG TPA: UTP--glucose-1-phosphate uridylyltransferase, partial [Tepidisphaeraceae bacterium]
MSDTLMNIIVSTDEATRNRALESAVAGMDARQLLRECEALDQFRRTSTNLYERVRALFFLYAIHRFHLPLKEGVAARGLIPFEGYSHLLSRRFEEGIEVFLDQMKEDGPSDAISSALASAYKELAFATLANQVRRSVRSVRGNQWMFRIGHGADQPLRIRPELLRKSERTGLYPILVERTPVRMDLSHSGWSDIFFLGMDYPEGARVLNVSIDLAVYGRDKAPRPPVEAYVRVIDAPVLRLVSVDLGADAEIESLAEVYDFARDYLGLLKAAIIAAGIVPPGLEGSGLELKDLLAQIVGPGLGLEVVSNVNNIPKGSRLAVSTNLLAGLIAVCMRATGQAKSLTGQLSEPERRLVAARAILGEWLGGSGGGWQDSGGVWPGMKLISGAVATPDDPEHGTSRGRLLPNHKILDPTDASEPTRQRLQDSLVLVHGGMAQNVGPILEMVTEKYLLRSEREWRGRQEATHILDQILAALRAGDVKTVGALTTRNFFEPIQTIIPWATTFYTETLIRRTREHFKDAFQGFWMLGGMSGGGMGFIFDPRRKADAQVFLQDVMSRTRRELQHALPFAMEPVVYDFAINPRGTWAELLADDKAVLPGGYYARVVPTLLRTDPRKLTPLRRAELDRFGQACRSNPELSGMVQTLFDRLFPRPKDDDGSGQSLQQLLDENGFDAKQHEQIRKDLRNGRIGLAQNRLPANTIIEDVKREDVIDAQEGLDQSLVEIGRRALADGAVAVVSLAAGVGSRWTQGAGVVKALHPFAKLGGRHRSFIEVHLAKSRRTGKSVGRMPAHVITTSYLTHEPIANYLKAEDDYGYAGPLKLSPGRSIGLRLIPMVRDLRFHWEETPQRIEDEQKQKVIESAHAALIGWAQAMGEGSDYTDNVPHQCLHPVGHWYEIPNLLLNGTLEALMRERTALKHLMLHNIDTLGADLDPAILGLHIRQGSCLSFEVITRRIDDRGGGLARVNGTPRLVEGLAMPREEQEFKLSYYNSMTTWIDIDRLLGVFGLSRDQLADKERVAA